MSYLFLLILIQLRKNIVHTNNVQMPIVHRSGLLLKIQPITGKFENT